MIEKVVIDCRPALAAAGRAPSSGQRPIPLKSWLGAAVHGLPRWAVPSIDRLPQSAVGLPNWFAFLVGLQRSGGISVPAGTRASVVTGGHLGSRSPDVEKPCPICSCLYRIRIGTANLQRGASVARRRVVRALRRTRLMDAHLRMREDGSPRSLQTPSSGGASAPPAPGGRRPG